MLGCTDLTGSRNVYDRADALGQDDCIEGFGNYWNAPLY